MNFFLFSASTRYRSLLIFSKKANRNSILTRKIETNSAHHEMRIQHANCKININRVRLMSNRMFKCRGELQLTPREPSRGCGGCPARRLPRQLLHGRIRSPFRPGVHPLTSSASPTPALPPGARKEPRRGSSSWWAQRDKLVAVEQVTAEHGTLEHVAVEVLALYAGRTRRRRWWRRRRWPFESRCRARLGQVVAVISRRRRSHM